MFSSFQFIFIFVFYAALNVCEGNRIFCVDQNTYTSFFSFKVLRSQVLDAQFNNQTLDSLTSIALNSSDTSLTPTEKEAILSETRAELQTNSFSKECSEININNAGIQSFSDKTLFIFGNLASLLTVDFSFNKLATCDIFSPFNNTNLRTIISNFSHATGKCHWPPSNISDTIIPNLKELSFNGNDLFFPQTFEVGIHFPNLESVSITNNNMEVLKFSLPSTIKSLVLKSNYLTSVEITASQTEPIYLDMLDLSMNYLEPTMFPELFANININGTLNLSQNSFSGSSADVDNIWDIPAIRQLETLILQGNSLNYIDIAPLTNIKKIDLSLNHFTVMNLTVNSTGLETIDFSANNIADISHGPNYVVYPEGNQSGLILDHNFITETHFPPMPINLLSISHNLLQHIRFESFGNLTLETINLSSQKVLEEKDTGSVAASTLNQYSIINGTGSNIVDEWPHVFCRIKNIDIRYLGIEYIDFDNVNCSDFYTKVRLGTLNAAHNSLTSVIIPVQFDYINFSHNFFTNISGDMLKMEINSSDSMKLYGIVDFSFNQITGVNSLNPNSIEHLILKNNSLNCCQINASMSTLSEAIGLASNLNCTPPNASQYGIPLNDADTLTWGPYILADCPCDPSCAACIGPTATECVQCHGDEFLSIVPSPNMDGDEASAGQCVEQCPGNSYNTTTVQVLFGTDEGPNWTRYQFARNISGLPVKVCQAHLQGSGVDSKIIIGVCVGAAILIFVMVIIVYQFNKRRKNAKAKAEREFQLANPIIIDELFPEEFNDGATPQRSFPTVEYMNSDLVGKHTDSINVPDSGIIVSGSAPVYHEPNPYSNCQLAPELRRRQVRSGSNGSYITPESLGNNNIELSLLHNFNNFNSEQYYDVHIESDIDQAYDAINSTGNEDVRDTEYDVMNESVKDDFEEAEIPTNDVLSSSSNDLEYVNHDQFGSGDDNDDDDDVDDVDDDSVNGSIKLKKSSSQEKITTRQENVYS